MNLIVQVAGFTAALVSIITFMPQALKVWRFRNDALALRGVSRTMLWCLVVTQTCWAVYGLGLGAIWNVVPSLFVLPLAVFMLYITMRSDKRSRETQEEKAR